MTTKDNATKELSRVARDYFGFKALVGAMAIGVALPYFIPISLPALIAWLFLYKESLARYGKRGVVLYYLAPTLMVIGAGLGFIGAEWRWAMSMIFVFSIFPLLPIREPSRPSDLWKEQERTTRNLDNSISELNKGPGSENK